jgi:hypothetical protein
MAVMLFCSMLGFAMFMPPVLASDPPFYEETRTITQGEWQWHFIGTVPAGEEVSFKLSWDRPDVGGYDLDFYVWDNGNYLTAGAIWNNPEMAFLSGLPIDTDVYVYVHGYYAPDPGVEYTLRVEVGPDVIPEPYAVSGGISVGGLQSWAHSPRVNGYQADLHAAHMFVMESNPFRQVIMPQFSWWGVYDGSGWLGPTFYAGDPLLVGGPAYAIPYENDLGITNIQQARAYFESLNVEVFIDDKPLEELGTVVDHICRPDNFMNQWFYRCPKALFHPGELYDVLPKTEGGLHTFTYKLFGEVAFFGYFYLLW